MAIITRPLSPTEIAKAKPKNTDYSLFDGSGLTMLVKTNGNRIWHFRYKRPHTNKRTTISFGAYPSVSISAAREKRTYYLSLLARYVDPKQYEEEKAAVLKMAKETIFINVALDWMEVKKTRISEDYALDVWRSLENDIFPVLGDIPLKEITARKLISALQPIKARGALETIRRICQRVNEIMIFAINTGLLDSNPASGISNAFAPPTSEHYATIRPEFLPKLLQDLNYSNLCIKTRCLLMWQLLTIVRPSEASSTEWSEIDIENKQWCIPAHKMKMKREHMIPLSEEALAILAILDKNRENSIYVFPSRTDPTKPMNSQTANAALKRIGYKGKLVAHGLRAVASTALNEEGFEADVIEAALSHIDEDKIRRAYNRSTYIEQRVELMDWWGKKVYESVTK